MPVYRKIRNMWFRQRKPVLCVLIVVLVYILYTGWTTENSKELEKHACSAQEVAKIQTNLQDLLDILTDPNDRQAYAWMRMRITRMWPKWVKAVNRYFSRSKLQQRNRKKILIFIGALTREAKRNLAEHQFKGGYLGELLQWSDLVAGLYLIGHDVTVISEIVQLRGFDKFFTEVTGECEDKADPLSLIYSDIFGTRHILKNIRHPYSVYKCRLRVLDVFGTDPAWNDKMFAAKHKRSTYWGGLDLNPRQFYTMYPENPDNSFLGFALDTDFEPGQVMEKDNFGLVYGKSLEWWQNKTDYLKVFTEAGFNLIATINLDESNPAEKSLVPSFVHNKGILTGNELTDLLTRVKVFIGLGSPIEGPAPLEALAHGAVYINPKFDDHVIHPTSRKRTTERFFTSQTPYPETSIGEPHVYTVSINDLQRVKEIADSLMKREHFKTVLPFEFTQEGFLQRLNIQIEKHCFCKHDLPTWPPQQTIEYKLGDVGHSCIEVCNRLGLVCEPNYFNQANDIDQFHKEGTETIECVASRLASDIYYPAIDLEPNYCVIQRNPSLFSCAGSSPRYQRLCPCRDYIHGQKALCKRCDL